MHKTELEHPNYSNGYKSSGRKPEDEATRAVIYDWREAIQNKDQIDDDFLKEILLAITEGLLNLDERIMAMSTQEWRGMREIISVQDEMNEQRYKVMLLQDAIRKVSPS